jgi:hypothetical protein
VENLVVEVRVVQEGLGGNAADVQAGSAEGAALLDTGDLCPMLAAGRIVACCCPPHLQAGLSCLDSCDISRNTTADDDQVLLLCPAVSACSQSFPFISTEVGVPASEAYPRRSLFWK